MKAITVKFQRTPQDIMTVGRLAEHVNRTYFEYDPAFLQTGLEISPFKLPAHPGLIEHQDHAFGSLPGVFDDSLPDGWGLLLMDRHFRRQGIDPVTLSPLDRLAYLGTRTMGALTYHPPAEGTDSDGVAIDLYDLGRHAEDVLAGDVSDVLPQLMRAGGSPGGARPKVLVGVQGNDIISGEDDLPESFEPWIVKFSAKADARDAGPVEYAYSLMAKAAGIQMPPTRLFEVKRGRGVRHYFGVQRFDRGPGNRRFHVHTFANLIHVNFRIPSTDYADLFKVTQILTRNHRDLLSLFRLMVFNVATHNRDDHAKNFAFMLNDQTREWALSPAYDLTYSPGPGGEHTTTVLGEGKQPTRDHCLKLAKSAGIKSVQVKTILDKVNTAVASWLKFASEADCSKAITSSIAKRIGTL
jgi:serine/threonine-protein kinase HipA